MARFTMPKQSGLHPLVYTRRSRPGSTRIVEHGGSVYCLTDKLRFTHTRLTTNNKSRSDQDFTQLCISDSYFTINEYMGSTSTERIKFALKVLAQRYSVKGNDVPTPAENQRLESWLGPEIRWVCLRHHEHRWHWSAWLCMRLFGDPRST